MEEKIKILLEKLQLTEESSSFFEKAELKKIIINKKSKAWDLMIQIEKDLPLEVLEEMEEKKYILGDDVTFHYEVKKQNPNLLLSYFSYFLEKLKKKGKIRVKEIYQDSLILEKEELKLQATSKLEEEKLLGIQREVNQFYQCLGYQEYIPVILKEDGSILSEINQELKKAVIEVPMKKEKEKEKEEKPKYSRAKKGTEEGCILGRSFKEEPLKMSLIAGEDNNVVVDGYVFGVDYFESSKSDFKIITLKITDETDSIYCKVFVKDKEEYARLCKELKTGKWFRIRGYIKNDTFAKEFVLNARDIMPLEKAKEERIDTAEEKRVELHTHTKMSQMDGVVDEVALVKQAIKWGHRGIAITDHNGAQAFPHVYNFVKDYNKGLKE